MVVGNFSFATKNFVRERAENVAWWGKLDNDYNDSLANGMSKSTVYGVPIHSDIRKNKADANDAGDSGRRTEMAMQCKMRENILVKLLV